MLLRIQQGDLDEETFQRIKKKKIGQLLRAFVGIVFNLTFSDVFGSWTPWISILAAMIVGAIFAIIHAVASITFYADQVVSGVAINFLALGIGIFLTKQCEYYICRA